MNAIGFPLQEAEEFAEQDRAVKARVDARNQLETYAYQMKSTVEDKAKDKVRVVGVGTLCGGCVCVWEGVGLWGVGLMRESKAAV